MTAAGAEQQGAAARRSAANAGSASLSRLNADLLKRAETSYERNVCAAAESVNTHTADVRPHTHTTSRRISTAHTDTRIEYHDTQAVILIHLIIGGFQGDGNRAMLPPNLAASKFRETLSGASRMHENF